MVLPSIQEDFGQLLINSLKPNWSPNNWIHPDRAYVHSVMTSEGYPATHGEQMNLGNTITIPSIHLDNIIDAGVAFFGGVDMVDKDLVNQGGRVLGITTSANSIKKARKKKC